VCVSRVCRACVCGSVCLHVCVCVGGRESERESVCVYVCGESTKKSVLRCARCAEQRITSPKTIYKCVPFVCVVCVVCMCRLCLVYM